MIIVHYQMRFIIYQLYCLNIKIEYNNVSYLEKEYIKYIKGFVSITTLYLLWLYWYDMSFDVC